MKLYRIARREHIGDLNGEGARIHGGRWNEKGVPVVYASGSRALAALEYLVHVPLVLAPHDLALCTLSLPDDASVTRLRRSAIPDGWQTSPPPPDTMRIGTRWAREAKTLLLAVPSAAIAGETNYLINPRHREFRKIRKKVEPFAFDPRLRQA